LVLFIHGGWWRCGADRSYTWPLAADLARRGCTVATLEYRRLGQAQGGWPGTFDDVALAVDQVPALLAFEGLVAAHAPLILAGHGSGGHLALWAAVRDQLPGPGAAWRGPPLTLAGVLALAPVTELTDAYYRGSGQDAATELLGGGPMTRADRYRAVDPGLLPVPHAPVALVHGTADDQVPVEQSRRYAARTKRVAYFEVSDVGHLDLIHPGSSVWQDLVVTALAELAWPTSGDVVA
jgi:acetyl esterase/lipase